MRIGTWNLAGRWSDAHHALLDDQDVDVWLLTEVSERVEVDGYHRHLSAAAMAEGRRWAGVLSRLELHPLPDPHPASAAARVDGQTFCSSILPWKGAWPGEPWAGDSHADKTDHAIRTLLAALPARRLVWGGDWNHALAGPEHAGSRGGRTHLLTAVERLDLQVSTASLPHRLPGLVSIDHVAVPKSWRITHAERIVAAVDEKRLSDHDAYVVDVRVPDDQSQLSQSPVSASS